MALKSFRVQPIKALGLTECSIVPKVMIIAGPNGVGKSTLLDQIRLQNGTVSDGDTQFLYQPPHRAIRRTSVQRKWLFGNQTKSFTDLLTGNDVGGFEGLQIQFPARSPDNVDEAGSTIKYTLGKIENTRQNIYAQLVDSARKEKQVLPTEDIPDVYEPLRKFTQFLLPHLEFDKVDFVDENSIKCIWKRKDAQGEMLLDIDDLSSGEKSIVILFLPLLEDEISGLLKKLIAVSPSPSPSPAPEPDRVFVIDEPELHLHPDLQSKILTYLRSLSKDTNIQFIVSTHSPTILDQALDDELYVLGFKVSDPSVNQLKKVASNIERLEALKQLAGSTYLVTTGRSIVCIEGDADATSRPADLRLFQILYPRSTAYTFIPTGGKGEVIKIVTKLREYLPSDSFGVKVFGLTDLDQTINNNDGIFTLPVCMIENLLLNSTALFNYLQKLEITTFSTIEGVVSELTEIALASKTDEISYRVMKEFKTHTVRLKGATTEELKELVATEVSKVQSLLPEDSITQAKISDITQKIEEYVNNGKVLTMFRGKAILNTFYQKHISGKNIPFSEFCYELAIYVADTGDVERMLNPIFDRMV